MPANPNRPPNRMMKNSTQNEARPVESPRIFGPRMLPSNCWSTSTNSAKYTLWSGSMIKMRKMHGMAPMNGPKNGMMFVTPMMVEMSAGYGNRNRLQHTRQMMPMMSESSSLPLMKPLMMR